MSRDIDNLMKRVMENTLESQQTEIRVSKDISELRRHIQSIEIKVDAMDQTLMKLFDILNSISLLIEDAQYPEDEEEVEDWTPYNENNFSFDDDDEDDNFYDSYNSYDEDNE